MSDVDEHPVEQAIRKSHCSHADKGKESHFCVGTCTITPQGVKLECKACGSEDLPIAPFETLPEVQLVKKLLDALGIDYHMLSPEAKARAARVAKEWTGKRSPW